MYRFLFQMIKMLENLLWCWLHDSENMLNLLNCTLEKQKLPGQVAQLVRALSRYAKVAGLISNQGTYKKQTMNA